MKSLCGDQIKSVLMVGDPHQMIYGFNGSSEDFLCKLFPKDFDAVTYELKENYRSSKSVIMLANKLKANSQMVLDYALEGLAYFNMDLKNEDDEASWIVDKIQELLESVTSPEIEGEISLEKMVVIGRNQYIFKKLEGLLNEKEIPFSLKKSERLTEPTTYFGKVLDLGIRLRINPKDWVDGKKLCTVLNVQEPNSWGHDDVFSQFSQEITTNGHDYANILSSLLTAISDLDLDSPNILKLVDSSSKILEDAAKHLPDDNEGVLNELERSLLELNEFKQCWVNFKRKGLGDTLAAFRNAMALGQLGEDTCNSGLTLSTVHTMKGLEKDIVFLVGMSEGTFPDYRAQTEREIEEERNNAFVAVTRSRRWIYITYPQSKIMPWGDAKYQKPSRFIYEMQN